MVLSISACEKATPQMEINEFVEETEIWHKLMLDSIEKIDDFYTYTMRQKLEAKRRGSPMAAIELALTSYEMDEYQELLVTMLDTAKGIDDELSDLKDRCPKECEEYFVAVEKEFIFYQDYIAILSKPNVFFDVATSNVSLALIKINNNVNKIDAAAKALE